MPRSRERGLDAHSTPTRPPLDGCSGLFDGQSNESRQTTAHKSAMIFAKMPRSSAVRQTG